MRLCKLILPMVFVAISAATSNPVSAADHQEAPLLLNRGQLDLNDLYVFRAPGNAANSVLVLTVNPFSGEAGPSGSPTTFGNVASNIAYEFSVHTNPAADLTPDITYTTTFTGSGATQTYTITRNGSPVAAGLTGGPIASVVGGGFATAGQFDDPFFFDLVGFRNTLAGTGTFTGANAFGAANISAIVLEIPSALLGATAVGIEARTLENGVQVDRTGRPAIATVLIPGGVGSANMRDEFNASTPATDFASFGSTVNARIAALSNQANADALDNVLLPDLMTYDSSIATGYLNGRGLADDVIDISLNVLTAGAITTDLAASDSPFSGIFPYLAPAQVPEPSSLALLAVCAAGFAGVRRLRRRSFKNA